MTGGSESRDVNRARDLSATNGLAALKTGTGRRSMIHQYGVLPGLSLLSDGASWSRFQPSPSRRLMAAWSSNKVGRCTVHRSLFFNHIIASIPVAPAFVSGVVAYSLPD